MRDRIIAGRMGIGFLKEVVTRQVPEGLKRLSSKTLAIASRKMSKPVFGGQVCQSSI